MMDHSNTNLQTGRRILTLSLVFAANLAIFTLLRLAFFLVFRRTAGTLSGGDVLQAFYLGLKFDARLAAIIVLPLLITRRFAAAWLVAAEAFVLTLYCADFGSYAYIHQRLNAGLFEFLRNPLISIHMVWESYHVVLFAATILAVVAVIALIARRTLKTRTDESVVATAVFAVLLLALIYGKVSRYPLRWSDAYFSDSAFIGEMALNPAQFLFETTREKPAAFDRDRVRRLYPLMASYLGVDRPDPQRLNFRRTPPVRPRTSAAPNIVLIQLESFAAFKTGAFGNVANASPNFDELARNGILFTHHYSPSEKTARALFAVMFGIPDVSPWQASAHNPLTVNQASIANAFTGYDKLYFLGGSANWSNIRAMLAHNIDGLRIFEEGSYDAPVVDVWGISDEDLFLAANDVLRREHKPFFAIIHTSGNHRPYTIPKQTHGFQLIPGRDSFLRARGFESSEEYNSFRYLDHAIGLYFNAARREQYFANTVFVLYGDHGTRTGASPADLAGGDLAAVVYHVPMLMYAPGLIREARRIDAPSSHVDILPTLAGFCGWPYTNQTLGIDLLDPAAAARSSAFIFTAFRDPPDTETIDRGGAVITRGTDKAMTLGAAFYETSRWLLYHNQRSPR